MPGFETSRHTAIADLDHEHDQRPNRNFCRQRPFGFLLWIVETETMSGRCPDGEAEEGKSKQEVSREAEVTDGGAVH